MAEENEKDFGNTPIGSMPLHLLLGFVPLPHGTKLEIIEKMYVAMKRIQDEKDAAMDRRRKAAIEAANRPSARQAGDVYDPAYRAKALEEWRKRSEEPYDGEGMVYPGRGEILRTVSEELGPNGDTWTVETRVVSAWTFRRVPLPPEFVPLPQKRPPEPDLGAAEA